MHQEGGPADAAPAGGGAVPAVGFIGLGNQGTPIARAIAAAGFPLTVWARRQEATAPFRDTSAVVAASVADLAARSDIVGVCVLDDASVDDVLGGTGRLVEHLRPGSTVVVHSTVSPDLCRRWAQAAAVSGIDLLDAPVSNAATSESGHTSAHNAAASSVGKALTVMVGGDQAVFERCRPVLESFGTYVRLLGPVGAGQYAKLLNNALVYAQMAMTCSALDIGRNVGMDPTALIDVLLRSSGRSHGMSVIASHGSPLDVDRMVRDNRNAMGALLKKDIDIVLGVAEREGWDLGALQGVLRDAVTVLGPRDAVGA